MSGKKGMKQYPASMKGKIREEDENGKTERELNRNYGISRWAIQTQCGLAKRKESVAAPKRRGRPRKKPLAEGRELELRVMELEREVAMYKAFLTLLEGCEGSNQICSDRSKQREISSRIHVQIL